MDKISKAKILSIIKTLLISQPHREWTSKNLADFINIYDYKISVDVTPQVIGQLMKEQSKRKDGYLRVERVKAVGNTYRYRLIW